MAVLGYCTIGSNRLEEARTFYNALLGSAGIFPMFEHPSGGRVYGRAGITVLLCSAPITAGQPRSATVPCSDSDSIRGRKWTPSPRKPYYSLAVTRDHLANVRQNIICLTFAISTAISRAPTAPPNTNHVPKLGPPTVIGGSRPDPVRRDRRL